MKKNSLLRCDNEIVRVLEIRDERVFVIPCTKRKMPYWIDKSELENFMECTEQNLLDATDMILPEADCLNSKSKRFIREHFTMIAGLLPYVSNEKKRKQMITQISEEMDVSKQTIRSYLCKYLIYQDMAVLAPKEKMNNRKLTQDEKNMRWGLNKFFYNRHRNSLNTAYTMMLKERYCDAEGVLLDTFPSFNQFKYFYKKHRKMQTYYISRDGLKHYQRNNRPLLGDGVQQFAPNVGIGMLDSTICDIYLVDDAGNLIGRPILTTCIEAYSFLCCGYSLSWEGGTYSLRNLMLNVISDKVEWCKKLNINIRKEDWNCDQVPGILITDMGKEYVSTAFEQISELGVKIVNLPPYRPELKGNVEKFFDLVQGSYKKHLKGKGVIEPDFQERGVHDYRKDACLTLVDFEKVIIRCIVHYNSKRVIEDFPYTEQMLKEKISPYANVIYEWGKRQPGANMITISKEELTYTLLPRTQGKFTRFGLKVNGLRYRHDDFKEKFLQGGTVTVAYNPDDVSNVWLIEDGSYIRFELIESRFLGKNLTDVEVQCLDQKELVRKEVVNNLQAKIDLAEQIQIITDTVAKHGSTNIKQMRKTRKLEQQKLHIDFVKEGVMGD